MSKPVEDLGAHIREVTADEVASYEENGWVMLRQLFSPELVAELLEGARVTLAEMENGNRFTGNISLQHLARDGIEPFRTVTLSNEMGRVAHTLINRARLSDVDVPIQYHSDSVWCKEPGASGTGFHQDDSVRPGDRPGVFNMWMALDEVTPDMGALRFLTGVHREGPLGHVRRPIDPRLDEETKRTRSELGVLNYYPKLTDIYEWSPPFHYQPGDATVHHGSMIHGGAMNSSDRQRWGLIMEYMPADTKYFFEDETRLRAGMNQHGLPEATFPIVYAPSNQKS
jgi:ectoine hydroxylase-related dioxygenase (phytanoyl-CoA dioxygenase family)